MRAPFPLNKAGLSLPVTGPHLAAGFADTAVIRLQAIEDSEHIRVVVVNSLQYLTTSGWYAARSCS
jgi:hypothetical protein